MLHEALRSRVQTPNTCVRNPCRYCVPFLPTGLVSVEDGHLARLYQHVFPPTVAPTLSFVGLPWKVGRARGQPGKGRKSRHASLGRRGGLCRPEM